MGNKQTKSIKKYNDNKCFKCNAKLIMPDKYDDIIKDYYCDEHETESVPLILSENFNNLYYKDVYNLINLNLKINQQLKNDKIHNSYKCLYKYLNNKIINTVIKYLDINNIISFMNTCKFIRNNIVNNNYLFYEKSVDLYKLKNNVNDVKKDSNFDFGKFKLLGSYYGYYKYLIENSYDESINYYRIWIGLNIGKNSQSNILFYQNLYIKDIY
jgi:hypothetical protein